MTVPSVDLCQLKRCKIVYEDTDGQLLGLGRWTVQSVPESVLDNQGSYGSQCQFRIIVRRYFQHSGVYCPNPSMQRFLGSVSSIPYFYYEAYLRLSLDRPCFHKMIRYGLLSARRVLVWRLRSPFCGVQYPRNVAV